MKYATFALALSTAVALAACVDDDALATETAAQELAVCATNAKPPSSAVMPRLTTWNGSLPADTLKQAWVIMALSSNPQGDFAVYQIDLAKNVVGWGAKFPAAQRAAVYATIVPKNQPVGGIRIPPGPIGPGGDGWGQVNALVKAGDILYSLGAR